MSYNDDVYDKLKKRPEAIAVEKRLDEVNKLLYQDYTKWCGESSYLTAKWSAMINPTYTDEKRREVIKRLDDAFRNGKYN